MPGQPKANGDEAGSAARYTSFSVSDTRSAAARTW